MKFLLFLLAFSFSVNAQDINLLNSNGKKQGVWKKTYENGKIRYTGTFNNDIPVGIFYYYKSGELQLEKEFFHQGKTAATYIFYKNGNLKASGLYVNELKDSTWNYFNRDSVLILQEVYSTGKLNGVVKTFYDEVLFMKKKLTNNILNGAWKQYFLNGKIKLEGIYKRVKDMGDSHIFSQMVKYIHQEFIRMI